MTQAEMHQATGLGPDWQIIWEARHALPDVEHLCGGLYGPGGTYVSEHMRLRYEATGTPGIEAAKCDRCRIAWVRAAGT
jgi:hypothetical protein